MLSIMEETTTDTDLIDDIKKHGEKIPAKIIEGIISAEGNRVIVKYNDPETKVEKKHTHEINFNPKRLENNKCTLYKYGYQYYLEDFVLGDKIRYETDKSINIINYYTDYYRPGSKIKQEIIVAIIMTTIILIYLYAIYKS